MKSRLLYIIVLSLGIMLAGTSVNQVSSQTQKSGTYQKSDTAYSKDRKGSIMKDSATHHKKMMKDTTKMKKTNKGGDMKK